jgi:hypothetical protein
MPLDKMILDPIMQREMTQHVQGLWKDTVHMNVGLIRHQTLTRFQRTHKSKENLVKREEKGNGISEFLDGLFTSLVVLPALLALIITGWIKCQIIDKFKLSSFSGGDSSKDGEEEDVTECVCAFIGNTLFPGITPSKHH